MPRKSARASVVPDRGDGPDAVQGVQGPLVFICVACKSIVRSRPPAPHRGAHTDPFASCARTVRQESHAHAGTRCPPFKSRCCDRLKRRVAAGRQRALTRLPLVALVLSQVGDSFAFVSSNEERNFLTISGPLPLPAAARMRRNRRLGCAVVGTSVNGAVIAARAYGPAYATTVTLSLYRP